MYWDNPGQDNQTTTRVIAKAQASGDHSCCRLIVSYLYLTAAFGRVTSAAIMPTIARQKNKIACLMCILLSAITWGTPGIRKNTPRATPIMATRIAPKNRAGFFILDSRPFFSNSKVVTCPFWTEPLYQMCETFQEINR